MSSLPKYQSLKQEVLQNIWGHKSFRDLQEEIIDSIFFGNDTLALLPTGQGKSLCYQLPAILSEGTCLVISPLLALMKDQVDDLKSKGIEADYLSSELDELQQEEIFSSCKSGLTKLLYISPERLQSQRFLREAQEIEFSFIAIDEAHCISEWGQDFRPSYKNIPTFREQFSGIPCIALTATATPKVLTEIKDKLRLKHPKLFQKGFRRTNINLNGIEISNKYEHILHFLQLNITSGLIYTTTRKEAKELCAYLQSRGLRNVDYYHAGLTKEEKHRKQNWWLQSSINTLISTNSFGMGIDKTDVRFVIHFAPPYSIENFYQEIGRAGRDGKDSYSYLLWDEQDLTKADNILKSAYLTKKEYERTLTYLYSLYQIAENEVVDKDFKIDVRRLQRLVQIPLSKIKAVLEFLNHHEIIYLNKNRTKSSLELLIAADEIENLSPSNAYFIELLIRTITGLTSYKVHFNEEIIAQKLQLSVPLLNERLDELEKKGYVNYTDGSFSFVRFLMPRNDLMLMNQYWKLFHTISTNRIRKWEEMKFFVTNDSHCKMKMILQYFGEKNASNCGNCSYCNRESKISLTSTKNRTSTILKVLKERAATLDEICILSQINDKELVLEELIFLLDIGKIKMLNFKTYTIA